MKKAQISFFIAAIVLLIILFMFSGNLLSKKPFSENAELVKDDKSAIEMFVNTCIDDALEKAVEVVAHQGGYFVVEEPLARFDDYSIPLYLHKNQTYLPSPERMTSELENYAMNHVAQCLSDFMIYREQGYRIQLGTMRVAIIYEVNRTRLTMHFPMEFRKGDTVLSFSEFSAVSDDDFASIYDPLAKLMEGQKKDLAGIPLSELALLALQHDFQFHLWYLDNETVLYELNFRQQNGENITFNFVSQYEEYAQELQ